MNINFNLLTNYKIDFLKKKFLSSLDDRQKKIGIIAAAALGGLLTCYCLMKSCCFKAHPLEKQEEIDDVKNQFLETHDINSPKISPKVIQDTLQLVIQKATISPLPHSKEEDPEKPLDLNVKQTFDKTTDLNVENLNNFDHLIEDLTPSSAASLFAFGQVRHGTGRDKAPYFMSLQVAGKGTICSENSWATAFACCIHSTESQAEIIQLLQNIGINCHVIEDSIVLSRQNKKYEESFCRLYNHLVQLHNALPGKARIKELKIYWNTDIEEILFPYLLKNENVEINKLLFKFVAGESIDTPFQAPEMDFTHQLQFVGMDKDKIMEDLQNELKRLSQVVMTTDILPELKEEINSLIEWDTPLMQDAQIFTLQNNVRIRLLYLEAKNENIDWEGLDADERHALLISFMSIPPTSEDTSEESSES